MNIVSVWAWILHLVDVFFAAILQDVATGWDDCVQRLAYPGLLYHGRSEHGIVLEVKALEGVIAILRRFQLLEWKNKKKILLDGMYYNLASDLNFPEKSVVQVECAPSKALPGLLHLHVMARNIEVSRQDFRTALLLCIVKYPVKKAIWKKKSVNITICIKIHIILNTDLIWWALLILSWSTSQSR